jgi:phenylalanyl-tRNA synthetase beta chain
MYISYKWLQELVDFTYTSNELEHILTMLGIEVEGVIDYRKKYENIVIAEITKCEKHPYADKLSLCELDYGTGKTRVVCGADNVEKGQNVVLAKPGAYLQGLGMEIRRRKIKDIESDGMICSQVELGTGTDGSGIWELPENSDKGMMLADFLGLNDIIFDVSLTPNKADCLSHIGIAREISAYSRKPVKKPVINLKESDENINNSLEVALEDKDKCPRYTARIIRGVSVGESPLWLKNRLIQLGLRPVNIIVDITNYVLMEQGQPLHAFDFGKVEGNKIICKTAKDGEKFITLDGKERILDSSMLMICDAKKNIAIGGVMGGENSEISESTKDILLESAFFNPASIRRTSKQLGIQSDASYRFERGVDMDNLIYSLDRAALLISELTGGKIEEGYIDIYPKRTDRQKINLRYKKAEDIIGIKISKDDILDILERLGFVIVESNDENCSVEVPLRRVDVTQEADLIEEIARLYNYDNIEPDYSISVSLASSEIPKELSVSPMNKELSEYLIHIGFNEIITQNITDPRSSVLFGEELIEITNPLGEELSIMRPSLIPSMLRTIERNIRMGNRDLRLFEIGKSFHKETSGKHYFINNHFEKEELLISLTGLIRPQQWGIEARYTDFYDIKGIVKDLFDYFGFDNMEFGITKNENIVYNKNSLEIFIGEEKIGVFGEVKNDFLKRFNVENPVFISQIDLSKLVSINKTEKKYKPVSSFPSIKRDIGFVIDREILSDEIKEEIIRNAGDLLQSAEVFDVYEGGSIEEGRKNIAFSLDFSSAERTLKEDEIDTIITKVINSIESKYGAKLRKF